MLIALILQPKAQWSLSEDMGNLVVHVDLDNIVILLKDTRVPETRQAVEHHWSCLPVSFSMTVSLLQVYYEQPSLKK